MMALGERKVCAKNQLDQSSCLATIHGCSGRTDRRTIARPIHRSAKKCADRQMSEMTHCAVSVVYQYISGSLGVIYLCVCMGHGAVTDSRTAGVLGAQLPRDGLID